MDEFVAVPAVALGCYCILMLVFLFSEKTRLKWASICIMAVYVLWAFGSTCMRLGVPPNTEVWYHISLFGLFMLPIAMLNFTLRYTGERPSVYYFLLETVVIVLFFVNLFTRGCFIPAPEAIPGEKGIRFVYHIGTIGVVPYLFLTAVFAVNCMILIKAVKKNMLTKLEFFFLISGKILLLLGNILINVPFFTSFPIDMFSGIFDALLMTSVLNLSKRFKQKMYVSQMFYRVVEMLVICLVMLALEPAIEKSAGFLRVPIMRDNQTKVMVFFYLIVFVAVFCIFDSVTENIYLKFREIKIGELNQFNIKSCQTLDKKMIRGLVQQTAKELLQTEMAVLCILDNEKEIFLPENSESRSKIFELAIHSPLIMYLQKNHHLIHVNNMLHGKDNTRDMESLMKQFRTIHVALIAPVFIEDKLCAVLFIGRRKRKYLYEDFSFVEALASSAAISIKNADLYEKAYWEARTDELTGMGNRKYFKEVIQSFSTVTGVSLVFMKLDDFKMYNQLYGNVMGDELIRQVAQEIDNYSTPDNKAFRYSATSYAMLLTGYSREEAVSYAENIRLHIMQLSSDLTKSEMMVTVSCGIDTIMPGEIPDLDMADRCAKAVYMAKSKGGNCTVIYEEGMSEADEI